MANIMEYGLVDEVAEMVGISEKEVVDTISEGKTGLVYNEDYRWAEVDTRKNRYTMLLHLETCVNALKKYFNKQ